LRHFAYFSRLSGTDPSSALNHLVDALGAMIIQHEIQYWHLAIIYSLRSVSIIFDDGLIDETKPSWNSGKLLATEYQNRKLANAWSRKFAT